MSCPKLYVDDFGANTVPGTTDMTAAFQAAAEAAVDGSVIKFIPGRTYKITGTTTITDNVMVEATGATIMAAATLGAEAGNRPDGVVNFIGTESALTSLSANAAQYAETVTVSDATGISTGDVIYFYNGSGGSLYTWYTDDGTDVARSHINRVKSISGSTLTLAGPIPRDLDATTYTCVVRTWAGLRNVGIVGGHWDGGGYDHALGNGEGTAAAFFEYCQDVVFRPETVAGFSGAQMWAVKCYGVDAYVPKMRGHVYGYSDAIVENTNSGFYGLRVDECRAVTLAGNLSENIRHTTDGARSEDVTVTGWHTYNNHRTPHGSHNGCDNWKIVDCHSEGPNGFALWRGFDCTVDSCSLIAPNDSEPFFYDSVGATGDLTRNYLFSNSKAITGREGIRLNANVGKASIANCDFSGAVESASYSPIEIITDHMESLQITGGSIHGNDCARVIEMSASPVKRDAIQLTGVRISGFTTNAIRAYAVSGETSLIANDLVIDSQNSVATPFSLNGTFNHASIIAFNHEGGVITDGISGSFVPTFGDSSNDCTLNASSLVQWVRHGNAVFMTGDIRVTSKGSATGNLLLKNAPFPVANQAGAAGGGSVNWSSGLTLSTASAINMRGDQAASTFGFYKEGTAGASALVPGDISASARFFFTASYLTDD